AILAGGRLVSTGRLTDMVAFEVRGWEVELVVSHTADGWIHSLEKLARRIVRISDGRYTVELPLDWPPDRILPELTAAGATLVSVNPIRETLEDFFVEQVTGQSSTENGRRTVGGSR